MDKKTFWADVKDFIHENSVQLVIGIISSLIAGTISSIISISVSNASFQKILDNLDNAEDTATKAELRSIAESYAEVLAENQRDSVNSLSLCRNKAVQAKMNAIFGHSASTLLVVGDQDQYIDTAFNRDGTLPGITLTKHTKNGCVSNASGEWVVWADHSWGTGRALCMDSSGRDIKVKAGNEFSDKYAIKVNDGVLEEVSCKSLKKGLFWGHF